MDHDANAPGGWPAAYGRGATAIGVAATVAFAALVATLGRWVSVDDAVWRAIMLARGCGTDAVVERAAEIATHALGVLLAAAVVLRVRNGGVGSAWPWLATWILGLLASKTLKHVFTRDRPSALPDLTVGYSFPSAHVMNGLVAMLAVIALSRGFRRRGPWRLLAAGAEITIVAGRLLLGRHWATDALGGALAALVLVCFVTPAITRRPRAAPVALGAIVAVVLGLDGRLGESGLRLSSPLVARHAAIVDVDVGPEMPTPRDGGWREAGLERPFGTYLWLEGEAGLVLRLDRRTPAASSGATLAFAGRPQKLPGTCQHLDVTLNGQSLARLVPFVGWREYRVPIPAGVLRPGDNRLAFAARRFAVTYARIAADR